VPVQHQPDLDARSCEHVDQGIDAEELDFPANEVTHAWLRDTKQGGRLALPQAVSLNHVA